MTPGLLTFHSRERVTLPLNRRSLPRLWLVGWFSLSNSFAKDSIPLSSPLSYPLLVDLLSLVSLLLIPSHYCVAARLFVVGESLVEI